MADLQTIPTIDIELSPEMDSWSSPPLGLELLIQDPTPYSLLIDDVGNKLLIG
jgi:hypothetical protein